MDDPVTERWQRLEAGTLCVQRCERCGVPQFPVGVVCRACGADELSWVQLTERRARSWRARGSGGACRASATSRTRWRWPDSQTTLGRLLDGASGEVGTQGVAVPWEDGHGIGIGSGS